MLNIFKEINNIPGVMGVLANCGDKGLISMGLEDSLSESTREQFKKFLDRKQTLAACREEQDMEIRFTEAVILTRKINQNNTLAIIGKPDLNLGLLNVTLDMLQEELKAATIKAESPQQDIPRPAESTSSQDTDVALSEPLRNSVIAIQQALFEVIGPLSRTIFSDSLKSWAQVEPASSTRLQELIDLLCMEIGDLDLENKFRQMAATGIKEREDNPDQPKDKSTKPAPKILVSREMAQKLTGLLTKYTTIMGSVGSLIMKSYLKEWSLKGEATEERIPELMKMLANEISDPKIRQDFLDSW